MQLWNLLKDVVAEVMDPPGEHARARPSARGVKAAAGATKNGAMARHRTRPVSSRQVAYDRMVREMLATHKVRVRRWRASMSGIAWYVTYRDGSVQRLIEAPRPKSPMSAAIFLHEIGHHAIGFNVYKPRCLEEYHAWKYALAQMDAWGIEVTERVKTRVEKSLKYAVGKAKRRGIRRVPEELVGYC